MGDPVPIESPSAAGLVEANLLPFGEKVSRGSDTERIRFAVLLNAGFVLFLSVCFGVPDLELGDPGNVGNFALGEPAGFL